YIPRSSGRSCWCGKTRSPWTEPHSSSSDRSDARSGRRCDPRRTAEAGRPRSRGFRTESFQDVGERHPHALNLLELIGVGPRPARILDLFLSRAHVVEVARQLATRAPQVDLEGEGVLAGI